MKARVIAFSDLGHPDHRGAETKGNVCCREELCVSLQNSLEAAEESQHLGHVSKKSFCSQLCLALVFNRSI